MRETSGRNAAQVAELQKFAKDNKIDLRAIELDVQSQESVDRAVVGDAIAEIIGMPFGKRPFRVHVDPTHDGAEVSFAVIDRMRTEMLHRVGLDELLVPANIAPGQRTN
jgi:hypothetical protein